MKKRNEDLSNVYKTRTAVKDRLIQLFKPFVKMSVFPWTNLAKILVQHKLSITNFVLDHEFPNFGSSYVDGHSTDEFRALYFALEEKNPDKRIKVSQFGDWPDGDAKDIALVTDREGGVILSLQTARDFIAKKGSDRSSRLGVKHNEGDAGLYNRGKNKRSQGASLLRASVSGPENVRPKGKKKKTPKSAATIEDDAADDSLNDHASTTLSSNSEFADIPLPGPLQPCPLQPRPKPHYTLPSTAAPLNMTMPPSIASGGNIEGGPLFGDSFAQQNFSLGTNAELDALAYQMQFDSFGANLPTGSSFATNNFVPNPTSWPPYQ